MVGCATFPDTCCVLNRVDWWTKGGHEYYQFREPSSRAVFRVGLDHIRKPLALVHLRSRPVPTCRDVSMGVELSKPWSRYEVWSCRFRYAPPMTFSTSTSSRVYIHILAHRLTACIPSIRRYAPNCLCQTKIIVNASSTPIASLSPGRPPHISFGSSATSLPLGFYVRV